MSFREVKPLRALLSPFFFRNEQPFLIQDFSLKTLNVVVDIDIAVIF